MGGTGGGRPGRSATSGRAADGVQVARFRHPIGNALLAGGCVVVAGTLAFFDPASKVARIDVWSWTSSPLFLALGVVLAARALRRDLLVTDRAFVQHGLLWRLEAPWSQLRLVWAAKNGLWWSVGIRAGKRDLNVFAAGRTRAEAVAATIQAVVDAGAGADRAGQVRLRGGILGGSAVVLLAVLGTSVLVARTGTYDRARFAARAGRDERVDAEVLSWDVVTNSDSDGNSTTRTEAVVLFTTKDERHVQLTLSRPGAFPQPPFLTVVYDRDNPTDADFGGGPRRTADAASAQRREADGRTVAGASAVALVGVGAAGLISFVRRVRRPQPGLV